MNYKDYELDETEYFIWCLLNQLSSNDTKINKHKNKLLHSIEKKIFNNNIKERNIKDSKLYIRFYLKE